MKSLNCPIVPCRVGAGRRLGKLLRSPHMERIIPVKLQAAQGQARELLDAVKARLGIVPNMTRSMAVAPPVLEAYLGFVRALDHGVLPPRVREQLALDV